MVMPEAHCLAGLAGMSYHGFDWRNARLSRIFKTSMWKDYVFG